MATDKLFLRNTQNHGLTPSGDAIWFDMLTTPSTNTGQNRTATSTAGGTEIQFQSGSLNGWIGPAAPAGGYTLTTTDINIWALEDAMATNIGGRYRIFKRSAAGVITEVGGGPFDDGVEFGTASAVMTWTGNVTDTVFAQDDRVLLRVYITNIGTMAAGLGTIVFDNGLSPGASGDSFLNITYTTSAAAVQVVPCIATM